MPVGKSLYLKYRRQFDDITTRHQVLQTKKLLQSTRIKRHQDMRKDVDKSKERCPCFQREPNTEGRE